MENNSNIDIHESGQHGTVKSYIIGFIVSLGLTLASYFLVTAHVLSGWFLGLAVGLLAMIQVAVQLLLFLHLGDEPKPRWNLMAFFFMLGVIAIIVLGSLWIIENLNDRMMLTMDMKG